ncbi:phosphopentomutase, partial [Enterococcus faecalis]
KKMTKQGSFPQGFNSDISATIAEYFEVPATVNGQSFLNQLQ